MSEESFGSLPDIFIFDFNRIARQCSGMDSTPPIIRGRNTVSLSALTNVEPRFQREIIEELNKDCQDQIQVTSAVGRVESRDSLRSRSSPAVCLSHHCMNITHGSMSGFSILENGESNRCSCEAESAAKKISDRMKFIATIFVVLMVFAVFRGFGG